MSRCELSAIIISFNGREFLADCITTLKESLKGIVHEIIIVDNGSSDGSIKLIQSAHNDLTIIENGANLGFAKAVNIGIRAANGEYMFILNQDLKFHSQSVRILLDRIKSQPNIGMIGPKFVGIDGKLQHSARALPTFRNVWYDALLLSHLFPQHHEFSSWRMGWFDHETEAIVDQPLGSAMMIPRRVIEKVGLFDERFPIFFNDVDFCHRLKDAGWQALYYPSAVVEHYLGGSTRQRPLAMKIESHRSMYRYLAKYARWYESPALWAAGFLLMVGLALSILLSAFRKRTT
jgi:GT2 family glycosyltransferase